MGHLTAIGATPRMRILVSVVDKLVNQWGSAGHPTGRVSGAAIGADMLGT